MEDKRTMAIIIANAVAAATPAETKKGSSIKEKNWNKFIDTLSPDKIEASLKRGKNPLQSLAKIAEIPMFGPMLKNKEGVKK